MSEQSKNFQFLALVVCRVENYCIFGSFLVPFDILNDVHELVKPPNNRPMVWSQLKFF